MEARGEAGEPLAFFPLGLGVLLILLPFATGTGKPLDALDRWLLVVGVVLAAAGTLWLILWPAPWRVLFDRDAGTVLIRHRRGARATARWPDVRLGRVATGGWNRVQGTVFQVKLQMPGRRSLFLGAGGDAEAIDARILGIDSFMQSASAVAVDSRAPTSAKPSPPLVPPLPVAAAAAAEASTAVPESAWPAVPVEAADRSGGDGASASGTDPLWPGIHQLEGVPEDPGASLVGRILHCPYAGRDEGNYFCVVVDEDADSVGVVDLPTVQVGTADRGSERPRLPLPPLAELRQRPIQRLDKRVDRERRRRFAASDKDYGFWDGASHGYLLR